MTIENLVEQVIAEINNTVGQNKKNLHQNLLTEEDAAAILQVKMSTLANWRCTGRYHLPYIKSGRLVRYRITDLAQWIVQRRQNGEC